MVSMFSPDSAARANRSRNSSLVFIARNTSQRAVLLKIVMGEKCMLFSCFVVLHSGLKLEAIHTSSSRGYPGIEERLTLHSDG